MNTTSLDVAAQVTERPALPLDEAFFRRLYIADRLPEFLGAGFTRPAAEALLADQFRLQSIGYADQFPTADRRVIAWRDQPVGRIIEADQGDQVCVVDFVIQPEHRGRGIGAEVLARVKWRARLAHRPVRLMCLIGSPAQRLYERAGFVVEGATADRLQLAWQP